MTFISVFWCCWLGDIWPAEVPVLVVQNTWKKKASGAVGCCG